MIGAIDRHVAKSVEPPLNYPSVFATIDHMRGADPHRTTVTASSVRPYSRSDSGQALPDVV